MARPNQFIMIEEMRPKKGALIGMLIAGQTEYRVIGTVQNVPTARIMVNALNEGDAGATLRATSRAADKDAETRGKEAKII